MLAVMRVVIIMDIIIKIVNSRKLFNSRRLNRLFLDYYGYPPVVENPPEKVDGKAPTVFYCIQEDLNSTLVNKTLNAEGIGVCNVSGQLVTCPIEIECQTSEADNCCEGQSSSD